MLLPDRLSGCLFHKHIHLAILAVKLQCEAPAVVKTERQRLFPFGRFPAVLHAIAQCEAYAMAALHEYSAFVAKFKGFTVYLRSQPGIELPGFFVCHIMQIFESSVIRIGRCRTFLIPFGCPLYVFRDDDVFDSLPPQTGKKA